MLKLKPPHELIPLVAGALAQGRRIEAASTARAAAKNASAEELRDLVSILADHVEGIGDARTRGRPPAGDLTPAGQIALVKAAFLAEAKRELVALLICRDLVDGKPVGPDSLSRLLFFLRHGLEDDPEGLHLPELIRQRAERLAADPALMQQLVDALKPLAEARLREWGLQPARVARQGFRTVYRRKVAETYRRAGVTPRDLKDVAHETSA